MQRIIFLLFILLGNYASAQWDDPLTYYVELKDSSSFTCKITHRVPKKYILVRKDKKTEELILWQDLRAVFLIDSAGGKTDVNTISKSDLKARRIAETKRLEHKRWDNCFIVMQTNDTVYAKIEYRGDYSRGGNAIWTEEFWMTANLKFADSVNREKHFNPADIQELYLLGHTPENSKYISVDTKLYGVVSDGVCKLVGDKTINVNGDMIEGYDRTQYFTYYKGRLTKMMTKILNHGFLSIDIDFDAGFKEKCRQVFSECPSVVQQIENKTLRSVDLREIVKEFNACLEKK